jgi:nucleotide-binding universal stress UspA family protein
MYQNILLMRNGCVECSVNPCLGVLLAKSLEASVTAVYVSEKYTSKEIRTIYNPDELKWPGEVAKKKEAALAAEEDQKRLGAKALEATEKFCNDMGVPCEKVYLTAESPAHGVLEVAAGRRCDLIVASTHPHGLKDLLCDAIQAKALAQLKIPVLCHHCG